MGQNPQRSTELYRGPMTITEGILLDNGTLHLMRYSCGPDNQKFYITLVAEEVAALRAFLAVDPMPLDDRDPLPGILQTEEEVAAAEALIAENPLPVPPELVTPPDISRLMRPEAAAPEGHATLRPARAGCVRFATEQPCSIACLPHTLCQLAPALQAGAETVYEHCAHQLAVARGMRELHAGAEVLLREDLARHGIPAESEYELHKYELARKDKRFPVIQE